MKKLLLLATSLCLAASAMAAEQRGGTIKQTTIKYNVPTCENCKTTAYEETIRPKRAPVAQPAPCSACAAAAPAAPCAKADNTCANKNLGIANPVFFVKRGQVSLDTTGNLWKQPKGAYKIRGEKVMEERGYSLQEDIYYGIYDRLALHLNVGYAFQAPKASQWKAESPSPVAHVSSYSGTVGLAYHLIDTCPFDLIVGVDGTWGRTVRSKFGFLYRNKSVGVEPKYAVNYTRITPRATAGFHIGYVTPYLWGAYSFAHSKAKGLDEDFYHIAPGVYIQPSKYWALDLNVEKIEDQKLQYNAGIDLYPYKNMAVGFQVFAKEPFDDPIYTYGAAARLKFVF